MFKFFWPSKQTEKKICRIFPLRKGAQSFELSTPTANDELISIVESFDVQQISECFPSFPLFVDAQNTCAVAPSSIPFQNKLIFINIDFSPFSFGAFAEFLFFGDETPLEIVSEVASAKLSALIKINVKSARIYGKTNSEGRAARGKVFEILKHHHRSWHPFGCDKKLSPCKQD